MQRIIYLLSKNKLTVPEECDADLLVDDLIDVFRDSSTTIHNSSKTTSLLMEGKQAFIITIEEFKR